jgi:hypothetical protein
VITQLLTDTRSSPPRPSHDRVCGSCV